MTWQLFASSLAEVVGGRWLCAQAPQVLLRGVVTDSRQVQAGQLFIALRGDRFDGHDYLEQAASCGVSVALVDRPVSPVAGLSLLAVADTRAALRRLAADWRGRFAGRVIGLTGSVGKSTIKHLLDQVLSRQLHGSASQKSFNNDLGVPLTILGADMDDDYLIVEIGTNHPGEIADLGGLARPHYAIVSYVGHSHLAGLGDLDAVAAEKLSLLATLEPEGIAIVNGDLPVIREHLSVDDRSVLWFGRSSDCHLRCSELVCHGNRTVFQLDDRCWQLPLAGAHNAMNATAVIGMARVLGLDDALIAAALSEATGMSMRMEVVTVADRLTLINDAYNANPESMAAALSTFKQWPASGRRVAILGDMLELGDAGADLHRALGEQLIGCDVDLAVLIGPLSMFAAEVLTRHWPTDRLICCGRLSDQSMPQIADRLQAGDTVLLKASRGMALERLVPVFTEHALGWSHVSMGADDGRVGS